MVATIYVEKCLNLLYNTLQKISYVIEEVIAINKRILKRRMWLKHRNEKNLIRRTKKKVARKHAITREDEYNRSLKKSVSYNIETHKFQFSAPLNFSFIDNPNETNSFFNKIIDFISNKRSFGKKIFIDISKIQNLTIDALMYLLAIVNNMNDSFNNKYSFSGNAPMDGKIKKMFAESGFYNFVRYQGREPIASNSNSVKIVSGKMSDTATAKQVADFVIDKAKIARRQAHFIYIMMIEMMSNTHKHAYNDNEFLLPQWYCYAEYDKEDTISFTFMDTGEGIPSTVHKNFAEKLDFLKIRGDDKYVMSALNGDFRTSTEQINRGKGLPKIRDFCRTKKIRNMKILANRANVSVLSDRCTSQLLDTPLRGTLYYWQVNINDLKGETQ